MQKIGFYLLPCKNYEKIEDTDVIEFGSVVQEINLKDDALLVPNEFYEIEDNNKISATDFLYGNAQTDVSRYLLEIISKQKSCSETYQGINDIARKGYVVILLEDITDKDEEISIKYFKDILKVKRYYLKCVHNYEDYIDMMESCFPSLVFHKNVYLHIKKLGKFEEIRDELTRHLVVLNDYARAIYLKCNGNEDKVLKEIKSKYNIICSGKGSNEEMTFKLQYGQYEITCNPHTKLFKKNTDQRIYFCWGRDEIEDHQIIVARIGDHWNKIT